MISGVIAKLSPSANEQSAAIISKISSHPALELGELINRRNLPITIESAGNLESEEITRWLMSLNGIDFVDVVFVHMEEDDVAEQPTRKSRKVV